MHLKRNILWNFATLAISGVIGVTINALTGLFYGPSALGVFNQAFAAFILFTQIGAFGLLYSVGHYVRPPEMLPYLREYRRSPSPRTVLTIRAQQRRR